MLEIFGDDAVGVCESQLNKLKRNSVLRSVLKILSLIPFEASRHNNAQEKAYIQKYGL
jgi:hypothetical protein